MQPNDAGGEAVSSGPSVPDVSGLPPDAGAAGNGHGPAAGNGNGLHANGTAEDGAVEPYELLRALQSVRVGDFSVRLPGHQTGLARNIAATFNPIPPPNHPITHHPIHITQLAAPRAK